jgi:hypothetical protein
MVGGRQRTIADEGSCPWTLNGSSSWSPPRGAASCWCPSRGNPDQVWGVKQRHHVAGTVNAIRVRAIIEPAGDGFGFTLGRTSPSGRGVAVGNEVTVEIAPEGPQRDDLAEDVAAALAANPDAGAFFDSLAQFHRRS